MCGEWYRKQLLGGVGHVFTLQKCDFVDNYQNQNRILLSDFVLILLLIRELQNNLSFTSILSDMCAAGGGFSCFGRNFIP